MRTSNDTEPIAMKSPEWHLVHEYQPPTDISESRFDIVLELPEMEADDIDVTVKYDRIVVRGQKSAENSEEGRNFYRQKRYVGAFQRVFGLPDALDSKKADATYKDGLLTISVPQLPGAGPNAKKIKITREK